MNATENVDRRKSKKRKVKQALSVGDCSEKNLETEGDSVMEPTNGNQVVEGTGVCDDVREGALLLKSSAVGGDGNMVVEDKSTDRDTTDKVVVGDAIEEKKVRKKQKRSRMKQADAVAAIPKSNSETEGGNLACETPNNGIEETTGTQAIEGTGMRDHDGASEGGSLLKNSPFGADDNILSEDKVIDQDMTENVVTVGNLQDEQKDQKTPKKRKKKKGLSGAVNPERNLETEGENLASQTQNSVIEQTTGSQAFEKAHKGDGAQEDSFLLKSSSIGVDDNIISEDKIIDQDTNENIVTLDNLHEEKKDRKMPKKPKKKKVLSDAVNPEQNLKTRGENSASQTKNSRTEHTPEIQAFDGTAVRESTQVGSKTSPAPADDNNASEDISIDQDMTENVVAVSNLHEDKMDQKKVKKRKKKKAVPAAAIPEKNLETEGNFSGNNLESTTDIQNKGDQKLKDMALDIDIAKPPQKTKRDQSVNEEFVVMDSRAKSIKFNQESSSPQNQFTALSGENICKIETVLDIKKNDVCADHFVTAAEVAVTDTENPDASTKKKKKKKHQLSNAPQLELNEEDGAKESTKESIPVNHTESKKPIESSNVAPGEGVLDSVKDVSGFISNGEAILEEQILPLGRSPSRKLLILDINGLLADIVAPVPSGYKPDTMLSRKAVFKRPFCESFLQFCFENFDVGIWSSRVKVNVDKVLDFLMGEMKNKLVFYWDRSHCTITRFPTIENRDKPLVLKELRNLWDYHQLHLGKYDQFNTLLLDDSPYKALCNPADTAIFPFSYQYTDVNDCSLGPGGDLRVYLERLAMADNIPEFVRNNPFGQRPIGRTNLSWTYYKQVLDSCQSRRNR